MPIVPPLERQVQENPLPNIRVPDNAPIEAFGGGAGLANQSRAVEGLVNSVADVEHKHEQMANESALTGLDLQASKEQTRIELGVKSMLGKNAAGSQDYAASEWEKVKQNLQGSASNPQQLAGLNRILAARAENLDHVVQTHTADQMQKFDQMQSEDYLAAQSQEAVENYQDPQRITQALDNQKAEVERLGQRNGWTPDMIALKAHDAGSLTNAAIVNRMIDNEDYKGAQSYYDANKEKFSGKDVGPVEKSLEAGKTRATSLDAWNQLSGMRLADGNPDEARMEKSVQAMDMPDQMKEKVLDFVKAKAGEARTQKSQQDKARDESFLNQAVTARKNGVPLEQALPLARQMANDPYDQSLKETAIQKIYAPAEVKTDPATKVALDDGIAQGSVTLDQIDKAYQDKKLSATDWVAARGIYRNTVIEGKSPEMQRANEQVKTLAKAQFGSNADGMNAFISQVKSDSANASPEERVKIANDKLKQDQSSTSRFWNWIPAIGGQQIPFSGQPQYQSDEERRAATSLVIGKFHQDLGVDTTKAIELGAIRSGSKASAAEAVDALSVAFGGYDKIKPGTTAHNAMQSLSRHGKVVTADSIKTAIQHHPDGNF